jgi:hypothetical protein
MRSRPKPPKDLESGKKSAWVNYDPVKGAILPVAT